MSRRYVEVALPPPLPRELTYAVPGESIGDVRPGTVVLVPVNNRLVTGFVTGDTEPSGSLSPAKIRDLVQVLDADSPLTPEVVDLCRWMASYYRAPIGSALAAALPPGVRLTTQRRVQLAAGPPPPVGDGLDSRIGGELSAGALKVTTLRRRLGRNGLEKTLRRMQRAGQIDILPVLEDAEVSVRREQRVRVTDAKSAAATLPELTRRAPRQASCLRYVLERGTESKKTLVANGFGYGVLRGLGFPGPDRDRRGGDPPRTPWPISTTSRTNRSNRTRISRRSSTRFSRRWKNAPTSPLSSRVSPAAGRP